MQKLLTAKQMRDADSFTIASRAISSADLMEEASHAFVKVFTEEFPDRSLRVSVYCGTGNNGGDGLAISRLLMQAGYHDIKVMIARFSANSTDDFEINFRRLREFQNIRIQELRSAVECGVETSDLIIDALLGSGLNKPLSGEWEKLVTWLNSLHKTIVSVDVPTGLPAEEGAGSGHAILHARLAISFQRPKLSFLLPGSAPYLDRFRVADIGLDDDFIQNCEGPYYLLEENDIRERLIHRAAFSHKGTFGHAMLVAGAPETMGAALLTSRACLYAGAGLTSACIPATGLTALNASLPEVMAVVRSEQGLPTSVDWEKYQAIGIGPGLGTGPGSLSLLRVVLKNFHKPIVLDADALNLIAHNYELIQQVPEHSVLTPHMKEFDRLFGDHRDWWSRIETGIDRATTLGCTIVLKNRYTIIFTPQGKCLFNPTGTPAMATGGSGDALTGIITSFLAQGYEPHEAAFIGTYVHGAAGERVRGYVATPSQLIDELPLLMKELAD